jgi:alginate lyase
MNIPTSTRGLQLTRRAFCVGASAMVGSTALTAQHANPDNGYLLVARTDRNRVLGAARHYLSLSPRTVTSFPSSRSPGGSHDFFSQADYFWPNPANPDGPYVNRDGQSNPDNFNEHRKAMIALSIQMPALTSAWLLTGNSHYGRHAADHLRAWFVTPETHMTPNLEFAQGVRGVSTGRSYGIIDTLHLVEVARAASMIAPKLLSGSDRTALLEWFSHYLHWMKSSEKGLAEKNALNNHAVCWALQASEFARLIGDTATRSDIATRFTSVFLPDQMAADGSFPRELERTKPYGYSIFNFDSMAMLCQSLLDSQRDLFAFVLPDGRGICKGAAFLYPYLRDRNTWPYKKDIEHFTSWPVRSPGLLFTGLACNQSGYLELWARLDPDPSDPEIIRNNPVRQPLLWFNNFR